MLACLRSFLDRETSCEEVLGDHHASQPSHHTAAHSRLPFGFCCCWPLKTWHTHTFRSKHTLRCKVCCDLRLVALARVIPLLLKNFEGDESATPPGMIQSSMWFVPNFWLARCLLLLCANVRSWQKSVHDCAAFDVLPDLIGCLVASEYKLSPRGSVSADVNHSERLMPWHSSHTLGWPLSVHAVMYWQVCNFHDWNVWHI